MKKLYICNDHVTGIFSAIYDAWKAGRDGEDTGIRVRGYMEQELFCEYIEVEESPKKAAAVEQLIRKHLGGEAYQDIFQAMLSCDKGKADAVLGTMFAARQLPDSTRIMHHLSHRSVGKVFELSRSVGGEAHQFKGFLRFKELENGVLFAEIEPKSQVLPCIAEHFSNRLPLENFMIYDRSHQMFLVHQACKRWILVCAETVNDSRFARVSSAQKEYERLWKGFCRSISIKERENAELQRSNLPLRYRQDIVEFQ